MTTQGTRRIVWQGGEDDFCLAATGDILALQDACSAGISTIYGRLVKGDWWLQDVREAIRLGLIGAGMKPEAAMTKVKTFVDANPRGLAPSVILAIAVIEAVIVGVPDDPVGKARAADATTDHASSTTTVASAAPQSLQ